MTAKEYLHEIKKMDLQITFYAKEIDHWRSLSTRVSGSNFEPNYNSSRNTEPAYVRCLEKIIELEDVINGQIDIFIELKNEATAKINKINVLEYQTVLVMRYINFMPWYKIADEMHYTTRWIYKLHEKALEALDEVLAAETGHHNSQ